MIIDLCECITLDATRMTPNVNEIIRTIQNANICTGTQCFASNADAGFGMITEHQFFSAWSMCIAFLGFVALIISRNRSFCVLEDRGK